MSRMAMYFVDLHPHAEKTSFPTMNYWIKALAPVAGFAWKAEGAGGAMLLLKYKAATTTGVSTAMKKEAIQWHYE